MIVPLTRPASEFQPTRSPILYRSVIWVFLVLQASSDFGLAFGITAKADLIERFAVLGGLH